MSEIGIYGKIPDHRKGMRYLSRSKAGTHDAFIMDQGVTPYSIHEGIPTIETPLDKERE